LENKDWGEKIGKKKDWGEKIGGKKEDWRGKIEKEDCCRLKQL